GAPRSSTLVPLYRSVTRLGSSCAYPPLYGAEPAAASTRPQFASLPKSAVLTSGDVAILRATAVASPSDTAPLTLISATSVAPSPSATICRASSAHTACSASANAPSSPRLPFALERTTASFVEHSPSTEIELKLSATAGRRKSSGSPGSSG